MINSDNFTQNASKVIDMAIEYASELGHTYVGSEHILLSLTAEFNTETSNLLSECGVDFNRARSEIIELVGRGTPSILNQRFFTTATKMILEKAFSFAASAGHSKTGTEHILAALIEESSCSGCMIIKKLGINMNLLCDKLSSFSDTEMNTRLRESIKPKASQFPNLFKFGKNMTDNTNIVKSDPLIGRNIEVERVLQILSRRNKNNPCLIGEAGVGKTAIVEGIAELFARNHVPDELKNKYIFSLDFASLLSGAKYRGDFEERIRACIDEAVKAKNIILFIDEIHMIVGAGAAEGAIDAANIMKPQLARGEIQIIGATTFDEYRRSIEKDAALERRFQPVKVSEPDSESCIEIIKGIRKNYEKYHNVKISDEIIERAVYLSKRFITDRFLPDKAIDILDEACACTKIRNCCKNFDFSSEFTNTNELEVKTNREMINLKPKRIVDENDINKVISLKTGIPIKKLSSAEANKLKHLKNVLSENIIGHDTAIQKIIEVLYRSESGLRNTERPIASFLFCGPTGVGKTELAKVLAEHFYDNEDSLIRIDMSEYMEKHSVSKLIGAPPGYAGYDSCDNNLCEKVRRSPYSLILFDEIEKSDTEVMNILLQILEDGFLTDSLMRKIDFRNTIIIMTSNIGADELTTKINLGFSETNNVSERTEEKLRKYFSAELINRIDEIVLFEPLDSEHLLKISRLQLKAIAERAVRSGINIEFTDNVVKAVAFTKDASRYGARTLRRKAVELVENKLAKMIVNSEIKRGDSLKIDYENNKLIVTNTVTIQ